MGSIQYFAMKKFIAFAIVACSAATLLPAAACSKTEDDARTAYKITCTYDGENTLTASCTVDYVNDTGSELGEIKFNLYANAYREGALYSPVSDTLSSNTYYNGKSYGGMEIISVTGCESWEIGGEDENILAVALSSSLSNGAHTEITIEYTLTLANVNHRTGVTRHTVNLGNFYPVACVWEDGGFLEEVYYSDGDPFVTECADYEVSITVPAGYIAAASGQGMQSTFSGTLTYSYSLENARDFCIVLSDEFSVVSAEVDGTTVNYYYYDDDNPQAKLDAATESLTFFSEKFGEYVYPTLSIVQTGFAAGGMEYPALAMINDGLDDLTTIYTIVHEIAHQWWYAMVGSDQINSAWQDEGLAEYSTLLFFENHTEYGLTREGLVLSATTAYRAYFTVYNQLFGNADTTMNRHLKDFISDYEYVNIAYNKGLLLFDTLRNSIGDDNFYEGLQTYYKNYLYKIASSDDICACFVSTGTDLESFFESFIEGKIII